MNSAFVILTAILSSGVVAALISASFSDIKERWIFKRQKIEELYISSIKWVREAEGIFAAYVRVCKGEITLNDALDHTIDRSNNSKDLGDHHLRIRMTIVIYEPRLLNILVALEDEQNKLNTILNQLKDYYKETGEAENSTSLTTGNLLRFTEPAKL